MQDNLPVRVDQSALTALSRSEIDSQIATAHTYRRDEQKAVDRMMAAIGDTEVAKTCFYHIPRAGKTIEGRSVHLARVVLQGWGNLRAQTRTVEVGQSVVRVEAVVHDLESNVAIRREVSRRITNSKGERYNDDMITMVENAAAAIALRNATFDTIPRAVVDFVAEKAATVALGNPKSVQERRKKAIKYFEDKGVSIARILARLDIGAIEEMEARHIEALLGITTLLRNHESTIEAEFPVSGVVDKSTDFAMPAPEAEAAKPTTTDPAQVEAVTPETAPATAQQPTDPAPVDDSEPTEDELKSYARAEIKRILNNKAAKDAYGAIRTRACGKAMALDAMNLKQLQAILVDLNKLPAPADGE